MLADNYTSWYKHTNSVRYIFPVLYVFKNSECIHPLKQKVIYDIVTACSKIETAIWVFGSATNIRCTAKSDVDIVVRGNYNAVCRMINEITNYNCDIINYMELEANQLGINICRQGVRVL